MTAIEMHEVAEPYIRRRAIRHLEKGRIVVFRRRDLQSVFFDRHGGDAARPGESRPKIVAKATRVDGVYDKDPLKQFGRGALSTRSPIPTCSPRICG